MRRNDLAVSDRAPAYHYLGASGRLLGREAILERVRKGDVFDIDTFSEGNLRGGAYDLRLARDFLITADGQAYGPSKPYMGKTLTLKPGDIAYVATRERLRLQWDIAANIVPKYQFVRDGLFVLHGGLVDPGYGLMLDEDENWAPRPDERIHLLVANISGSDQSLIMGQDKVATLQFFALEPVPVSERHAIRSAVETWERQAANPGQMITAMSFFKRTTAQTHELEKRVDQIDRNVEQIDRKVEHVDVTNERVVAFGVYVMAAALLTGGMAVLVALFSTPHRVVQISFDLPKDNDVVSLLVLLVVLALAIALAVVMARGVVKLATTVSRRRRL